MESVAVASALSGGKRGGKRNRLILGISALLASSIWLLIRDFYPKDKPDVPNSSECGSLDPTKVDLTRTRCQVAAGICCVLVLNDKVHGAKDNEPDARLVNQCGNLISGVRASCIEVCELADKACEHAYPSIVQRLMEMFE